MLSHKRIPRVDQTIPKNGVFQRKIKRINLLAINMNNRLIRFVYRQRHMNLFIAGQFGIDRPQPAKIKPFQYIFQHLDPAFELFFVGMRFKVLCERPVIESSGFGFDTMLRKIEFDLHDIKAVNTFSK